MNRTLTAVAAMIGLLVVTSSPIAAAEKQLKVVATLSTFADLAKTIGGDHIDVTAVASPKFNPHFIEPKPSDVLRVKRAALFIHAGLDLEAWRSPLLDAAGNTRIFPAQDGELDLSRGIPLLEVPDRQVTRAEGDIHLFGNPHYWLDPENGKRMAQAICEKLSTVDPAHAEDYHRNLHAFVDRLTQKEAEWRAKLTPFQGRELVGYHNEWPYLMQFAGLKMEHFLEPKPGIPPTPRQVEFIEQYVKRQHITTIVQPSYVPTQTAETVARRTGSKAVTLCQSVHELPVCADYVSTLDYNITQLVAALGGGA